MGIGIVGKSMAFLAIGGGALAIAAKMIPGVGDVVSSIEQSYFETQKEKIGLAVLGTALALTMWLASALINACRSKKVENKGVNPPSTQPATVSEKAPVNVPVIEQDQSQLRRVDDSLVPAATDKKVTEAEKAAEVARQARINVPELDSETGLITIKTTYNGLEETKEVDRKYLVPRSLLANLPRKGSIFDYNSPNYYDVTDEKGKAYTTLDGKDDLVLDYRTYSADNDAIYLAYLPAIKYYDAHGEEQGEIPQQLLFRLTAERINNSNFLPVYHQSGQPMQEDNANLCLKKADLELIELGKRLLARNKNNLAVI